MQHRKLGEKNRAHSSAELARASSAATNSDELIEAQGRFGRDIGVVAFRRAADLVPARCAGDCGQAFYQPITYRETGSAL